MIKTNTRHIFPKDKCCTFLYRFSLFDTSYYSEVRMRVSSRNFLEKLWASFMVQ